MKGNIVPKTGIGCGPFTPNFLNTPKCHVEYLKINKFIQYEKHIIQYINHGILTHGKKAN